MFHGALIYQYILGSYEIDREYMFDHVNLSWAMVHSMVHLSSWTAY